MSEGQSQDGFLGGESDTLGVDDGAIWAQERTAILPAEDGRRIEGPDLHTLLYRRHRDLVPELGRAFGARGDRLQTTEDSRAEGAPGEMCLLHRHH